MFRVVAALAAGGAALLVAWALRPDDPSGLPPCAATSEEIAPPVTSRFLPPDLRIDDDPIEVAVTADGRLWFGGEPLDPEELVRRLEVEVDGSRDMNHPSQPSSRPWLLRADARAKWQAVKAAIRAGHGKEVRLHRLHLAVTDGSRPAPLCVPLADDWGMHSYPMSVPSSLIVRLARRSGKTSVLVPIGATWSSDEWIDLGPGEAGFAELRSVLRLLHTRMPDAYLRLLIEDDVLLADVVRALDITHPFKADVSHRLVEPGAHTFTRSRAPGTFPIDLDTAFSLASRPRPPPVLVVRRRAGPFPAGDDVHAMILLAIGAGGLGLLALTAGPPDGIGWIFGLKIPIAFVLLTALHEYGDSPRGTAYAQWAIPVTIGVLLMVFARPRRIRYTVPPALFFAALLLTEWHGILLQDEAYAGRPRLVAESMRKVPGREMRLWTAAREVEEQKGFEILPEGPLRDVRGFEVFTRWFLRDAPLVDVRSERRWHTFFTGIYRVVPACPDLEVWSPGGPREEVIDRLEFRRRSPRASPDEAE